MWALQVRQSHAPMIHHMGARHVASIGVMGNARLPEPRPQQQALRERGPARPAAGKPRSGCRRTARLADLRFQLAWLSCLYAAAHGGTLHRDYAGEDEAPKQHHLPQELSAGSCYGDGRRCEGRYAGRAGGKDLPDDTAAQQTALDSIQRYGRPARADCDEDFTSLLPYVGDRERPSAPTSSPLLCCWSASGLEATRTATPSTPTAMLIPGVCVASSIQGSGTHPSTHRLKGVSHSMAPCTAAFVAGKNALKDIWAQVANNFQAGAKIPAPEGLFM